MAKKMNGKMKIISLIVTLFIILVGLIGSWMRVSIGQEEIKKDYKELKEDGCDKSMTNVIYITEIRGEMQHQRESLERIETQQKDGFREIKTMIQALD